MENQKEILRQGMDALFKNFDEKIMRDLYSEDYKQHNPNVPTGLEAVIGLLPVLKESKFNYTMHRMIEDGDLLVTHTTYNNAMVFGSEAVIAFDLWRMENGKIVEHWDAITPKVNDSASGRTQTDGHVEVTDLDKTTQNKELTKSFVTEVLINGHKDKILDYLHIYEQHNPILVDGPEALLGALDSFSFSKLHRVVGEGNFVLTQSEGTWQDKPMAIYDLFRVENDKIVEHWDVIQEIPEKMAHANGMI